MLYHEDMSLGLLEKNTIPDFFTRSGADEASGFAGPFTGDDIDPEELYLNLKETMNVAQLRHGWDFVNMQWAQHGLEDWDAEALLHVVGHENFKLQKDRYQVKDDYKRLFD